MPKDTVVEGLKLALLLALLWLAWALFLEAIPTLQYIRALVNP